jgi:hypothetical protein
MSDYIVNGNGTKCVMTKTWGNENMEITVMLVVLAHSSKLQPNVILDQKTVHKE